MSHMINLNNKNLRTDLLIENVINSNNIKVDDNISVTDIKLNEEMGKTINKKKGRYITISYKDITDYNNKINVIKTFTKEFSKLLKEINIKDTDKVLIVGLGNINIVADSLGAKTTNNILVTKHLFDINEVEEGFRCVSILNPSVKGLTGIETHTHILSLVKEERPDILIVIDALASSSIARVTKTIQMSTAGINPGSGVSNSRKEISFETIGLPVISVGVPTVVDAATIVSDTITNLYKHFTYTKDNINNPMNKLLISNINYLKKDISINKEDKEKIFGIVGLLNEDETKKLISEVLSPTGYNMIVTPKEVDYEIDLLSNIISTGINKSLHKKVNHI